MESARPNTGYTDDGWPRDGQFRTELQLHLVSRSCHRGTSRYERSTVTAMTSMTSCLDVVWYVLHTASHHDCSVFKHESDVLAADGLGIKFSSDRNPFHQP